MLALNFQNNLAVKIYCRIILINSKNLTFVFQYDYMGSDIMAVTKKIFQIIELVNTVSF